MMPRICSTHICLIESNMYHKMVFNWINICCRLESRKFQIWVRYYFWSVWMTCVTYRLCFADDLKIYSIVNGLVDFTHLQSQLSRINTWCTENRLNLNVNKFKGLSYSRKHTNNFYELVRCSTIKALGVILIRPKVLLKILVLWLYSPKL